MDFSRGISPEPSFFLFLQLIAALISLGLRGPTVSNGWVTRHIMGGEFLPADKAFFAIIISPSASPLFALDAQTAFGVSAAM
jgi:hypothetical protein